jgi:hypothetical protein
MQGAQLPNVGLLTKLLFSTPRRCARLARVSRDAGFTRATSLIQQRQELFRRARDHGVAVLDDDRPLH